MPDAQGKLSDPEKKAFQKWLEDHWSSSPICFVCQKNNWIVGDHIVTTARISDKGDLLLGGEVYPQVLIVCGNCGFTLSFNARVTDIVKDNPQEAGSG